MCRQCEMSTVEDATQNCVTASRQVGFSPTQIYGSSFPPMRLLVLTGEVRRRGGGKALSIVNEWGKNCLEALNKGKLLNRRLQKSRAATAVETHFLKSLDNVLR